MITYENTRTIRDLVSRAGKEHGDHVFLRYEENGDIYDVTYRQFAEDCEAVAVWAEHQSRKLGHKIKVALMGSSSHHYLAVMLGVMSSGGVSVPLDIQLDLAAFSDNLNRSDVDVVFYDWDHHALVEGARNKCPNVREYYSLQHGNHVPCSDHILKKYEGQKGNPETEEKDLAMILFTSGTTGRGKGVMLSQQNLIDNVFCTTDDDHPEKEVYLNILPIHHVFCINGDVLIVMRYGSTLCLNRDMSKLAAHIQMFQPSVIRMVPMVAKALYNRIAVLSRQSASRSMAQIRTEVLGHQLHKIISGGGYLAPELAANFNRLGISIAQGYGMSECAPKISSPDWSRPDKVASVGRVVDRCQVRIVDGEIQAKSPSVMMGYYKEPDKTAEAITEDGWLRTGDLGYIDDEGFLYLTGRKKNLIILSNGENVAPEQLENLFEDDRLVAEILVFGEDDTITAEIYPNYKYAEAAGITDIDSVISEIIRRHNEGLPSYKRIQKYRIRETPFEKTSSKKIKRQQYFTEKRQQEDVMVNNRRPENELQAQIFESIANVLGHQRFGIDTDIYEAGMDSMGSVMLLTDFSERMKANVTLDDLLTHTTVLSLEELLKEKQTEGSIDYTKRDVYPLTNLQLYFAYVMRGNTTANLPFFFRLDPSVDLERLKKAVETLFDVHPQLKGVIQMDEGVYKNFRYDDRKIEIPVTTLNDSEWEKERRGLLKPFLYGENEPLYHVGIYRTDSANYLFFDIAHIMGDGVTMNILFEDLNHIYAGEQVEPEKYTFYEYILDEKAKDAKGLRGENIKYGMELMKNFRVRKSILNRKEWYGLNKGVNAEIKKRFETINRKNVAAFCRKHGISENALFLTAYNYCIGIFSNEKDTISSSIHSGRTDSRWSRLAGPLFLTYNFRYTNIPHETVPQLLKRSGRQIMESMRCYISNLHTDEMFFQYQGDILNIDEIGGAPAERQPIRLDSLPFHLQVMSDKKGYYYVLRFWENRFDREQLKIFMICMEAVAEAMLEEPSVRRLKKHLPVTVFPVHYEITAGKINREADCDLVADVAADKKIKAYVLDDTCHKQPFGAWGDLYVMDHPTAGWVDKITNPYGKGMLYKTGRIARILPDGSIDMLENGGRTIMQESVRGRNYLNLHKLETVLKTYENICRAEAYTCLNDKNGITLAADIFGTKEPDMDTLRGFLKEHVEEILIPEEIHFTRIKPEN